MPLHIVLLVIFSLFSSAVFASSLDLNANDEAVRVTFANASSRNVVTDIGALFLDKKKNDTDVGVHAGVHLVSGNLRFGIRAFYVTPGPYDALSIGFGLQAHSWLNKQIGLGGQFYYAPNATSFMDSNGYREYAIRLMFRASKNLNLYLGYRDLKVKINSDKNNLELDDGIHLGFKLFF